ncbi:hypothetical protein GGF41_003191 [Coemansia sp. RSA 2531]|nr:hypothetical protein GGF41_003191 [Coemansia sp. RSA 2531]
MTVICFMLDYVNDDLQVVSAHQLSNGLIGVYLESEYELYKSQRLGGSSVILEHDFVTLEFFIEIINTFINENIKEDKENGEKQKIYMVSGSSKFEEKFETEAKLGRPAFNKKIEDLGNAFLEGGDLVTV